MNRRFLFSRKYTKEDNINSHLFYLNIHGHKYAEYDYEDNTTENMASMQFVYIDVGIKLEVNISTVF
jgi:hypothetical protein